MRPASACAADGTIYLYRAVDKHGKTVATHLPRWPRKITFDAMLGAHLALRLLRQEDSKWHVVVRSCRYLNNIVEQDHRAIKRRCAAMMGFKSFRTVDTGRASGLRIVFASGSSHLDAAMSAEPGR